MSASTTDQVSILERFRDWRRSRPFWGGVTAILAGVEMYALTAAPFSLLVIQGIAGVSALLIMILMIVLALVSWYQPHLRTVTGLIIVVLALASILLTNLGGFLIGMLLGVHSGASIASWKPRDGQLPERRPRERRPRPWMMETAPPVVSGPPEGGELHEADTIALGDAELLDTEPETDGTATETDGTATETDGTATETGDAATEPGDDDEPAAGDAPGPALHDAGTPTNAAQTGTAQSDADQTDAAQSDPTQDGAAGQPSPPLMRRPRRADRMQGLGVVLLLLALTLTPSQRPSTAAPAAAATVTTAAFTTTAFTTTVPAAAPAAESNLFCDLFPWLCPAPSPSPGPSPSPSPSPSNGNPLPSIPGVTDPQKPGDAVAPSTCDASQMPARPTLGSRSAEKAASILKACLADQESGDLKVSTKATAAGLPLITSYPAHLVATKETMTGLAYDGVVTLQTATGAKRALKFRADSVTIEGIRQTVTQPGVTMKLTGPKNVVLSGNVELYVYSQSGKAFGLLPLDLDPDNPPPLVISYMVFTEVDSQVAFERADKLSFPSGGIAVS